jgi:hypothetical protein
MISNSSDSEMEVQVEEIEGINNVKRQKLSKDVKQKFDCDQCDKKYSDRSNLMRHKKSMHNFVVPKNNICKCRFCNATFSRLDNRLRHEKSKHSSTIQDCQPSADIASCNVASISSNSPQPSTSTASALPISNFPQPSTSAASALPISTTNTCCDICGALFATDFKEIHEAGSFHKLKLDETFYGNKVQVQSSAFGNRIMDLRIQNTENFITPEDFFNQIKNTVCSILHDTIVEHTCIKFNFTLICLYMVPKVNEQEEPQEEPPIVEYFHSTKMSVLTKSSIIDDSFNEKIDNIATKMGEFQVKGSGWSLTNIIRLELSINKYDPFKGNSYIKLPNFIKVKKAVINIANADEYCFAWAVNAAIHHAANSRIMSPHRVSSYSHFSQSLNVGDIEFPMKIIDIKKFELLNPNISINVFGVDGTKIIGPFYYTANKKSMHVNLLYIQDGNRSHYCYIKNMSK